MKFFSTIQRDLVKTTTRATALSLVLMSSSAFAEKYLVILKDKDVFTKTHSHLQLGGKLETAQWMVGNKVVTPFARAGVQVQNSLEHLQTLVIDADNESQIDALQATGLVSLVEKEFFHPAPRPVVGYQRTQAWSFSLKYAVPEINSATQMGSAAVKGGIGPKTPWGISAVRAPQAWALAQQGKSARVLVLDTGIDRDHPAFKDNFEMGKDFTGESEGPYEYADKEGHGSHCAGTVAGGLAADGFTGVAPQARLLAGRVCSVQGCSSISVVAGMNWAIEQKVDVVSMSLGGPRRSLVQEEAIAALEKAGISVVAASGNDGRAKVSFPAAFPTAIAVGAIDKYMKKASFSDWGPELMIVAPGVDVVSSVPQGTGRQALASINGKPVNASSFGGSPVTSLPSVSSLVYSELGKEGQFPAAVAGKFALVARGEITFADKLKNAIAAGAIGMVIFNNEAGLMSGDLKFEAPVPVVMIEKTIGEQIKIALDQGQQVTASIQTAAADYASFAGTSMATPHVAGVVALMKATNKKLTPEQVRSILKTSAEAMQPNTQNELGAGLVNAEAAVKAAAALISKKL